MKKYYSKVEFLKEKKRLESLLYFYVKTPDEDLVIKRMIADINNKLRVIEELKKRTR